MHVDYLYGGGYYVLHNVRVSKEEPQRLSNGGNSGVELVDIYMLVESIDRLDEMKKLKVIGQQNKNVPTKKHQKEETLYLDDFIHALNGFGRIIYWRCFGDIHNPLDCAIEYVQEGKFKQGAMDGYCRSFDALDDGFVEVGFFKDGVSQGKYMSFKIDGTVLHQGIKDGDDMIKEVEIADFKTRNLQSDLS